MIQLLAVLGLIITVNCLFIGFLISDITAHTKDERHESGNIFSIGIFSFFQFILSSFGISDFAVGAAVYSKSKWVSVKKTPGTVNTAAVIPVAIMSIIYITSIEVDLATLIVPIIAQMIGAYLLPRFVVKMPLKPIRIFLALGMLVTVLRIAAEGFGFFPDAGTVSALSAGKLVLLGFLCLVYGGLNNFGLGSYAPTMATVYLLGLNPEAAFPIMMGAAAFSIPVAGIQFIRNGSYSRKVTIITSICGTIGVLTAAFLISDVDFTLIKWLTAAVLVYSACSMLLSALKNTADTETSTEIHNIKRKNMPVGGLTGFCLVIILICAASLIFVFVTNFYSMVSDHVETSISENNTKIRDNVEGYLREQENFVLSAGVGVSHFMSSEPVNLEQLQRYLEETARIRDDVSTLYCTTNEVWNKPGGYAVFSQPWDVPEDWDNTERPWFLAAKSAGGKIAYSKPYIDALTGDIILDISANVYDENGIDIGVVSEAIAIEELNSMLQRSVSIEGQSVFLIDSDGVFVVHPDKMMVAKADFFTETELTHYRNDILYAGQFVSTDKGMSVYSLSIPVADWFVVSIIPTESIYLSAISQIISVFLSPMLIILFMLLAVLISLTFIVRQERKDKVLAQHLSEELRIASKSKSDFLATMSHEIRTPMNAIIGIAQIELQKDTLTNEYAESMKKIYNSGNGLLGIINDILDLSKIETGKLELNPKEYDVPTLINDTVSLNIVRIGSKPIEFKLDIDASLPLRLIGDELRLKQILNNLLSNAIKYTENGYVKLIVRHTAEGGDVILRFAVEDTGQGIKPENCERLFTRYSRFNAEANRTTEGTGLGLSITKNLVTMMGGDIKVESDYGKGSVFTATVIQKYADDDVIGAKLAKNLCEFSYSSESQDENLQIDREHMSHGNVLVVDDVETNLYVAKGLLSPYGLRIETAASGFETLDKIQNGAVYDIIFMDHMMPEMDGIETVKKLRASGYKSPIIALTANAITGNDVMFKENGFDGFISKPIDIRQLDEALHTFVRKRVPRVSIAANASDAIPKPDFEITGIDVEVGIRNVGGSADNYKKTLKFFCKDANSRLEKIPESLEKKEMKLFTTHVHAIKSAAANIGALSLSETAKNLEAAGKIENVEYIETHIRSFLSDLNNTMQNISAYLLDKRMSDAEKPENSDMVRRQLEDLRTALMDIDINSIDEIVSKLSKDSSLCIIDEIAQSVLMSDYESAIGAIDKYLAKT